MVPNRTVEAHYNHEKLFINLHHIFEKISPESIYQILIFGFWAVLLRGVRARVCVYFVRVHIHGRLNQTVLVVMFDRLAVGTYLAEVSPISVCCVTTACRIKQGNESYGSIDNYNY